MDHQKSNGVSITLTSNRAMYKRLFANCHRETKELIETYAQFTTKYSQVYTEDNLEKYFNFQRYLSDNILRNLGRIKVHEKRKGNKKNSSKKPEEEGESSDSSEDEGELVGGRRGEQRKWAKVLRNNITNEEFSELYTNKIMGTPFHVHDIGKAFKQSLPLQLIDIINTMTSAQVSDMKGIVRMVDASIDSMAGLFSTLLHALGIEECEEEEKDGAITEEEEIPNEDSEGPNEQ